MPTKLLSPHKVSSEVLNRPENANFEMRDVLRYIWLFFVFSNLAVRDTIFARIARGHFDG